MPLPRLGVFAGLVVAACASSAPIVYGPPVGAPTGVVTPLAAQGPFQPNLDLKLCPGNPGSNAPAADRSRRIIGFKPLVVVNGVILSSAPANDACLTSGFGPRFGRKHEGIDLQSRPAGPVFSAGPGVIREVSSAGGFGKYVLIDHGAGVFTRYAHLANFAPGIAEGVQIGFGQELGLMGATGNATAIHLHYEVLTGDYSTPRKSFGLTAHDPQSFPEYVLDGIS